MAKRTLSSSPVAPPPEPAPPREGSYKERLLRIGDVCFVTGLGRSTVYALAGAGRFPRPVQLHGACVAWRESEVNAWIEARPATTPWQRGARAKTEAVCG